MAGGEAMWTHSASLLCALGSAQNGCWGKQVACNRKGREADGRVLLENKEGLTVGRPRARPQRVIQAYVTHC